MFAFEQEFGLLLLLMKFLHTLNDIFVSPLLQNLGIYTPPDPTYGRYLLPLSPAELVLAKNPDVHVSHRRVFIRRNGTAHEGCDVRLVKEELAHPLEQRWLVYQVWQKKLEKAGRGTGCDLVMLHGTSFVLPLFASSTNTEA